MTLQEIFDALAYGELSQISIGGQDAGLINESNYDRILPHINLALTAIYSRFSIKEDRVTFPLQAGGYTYGLQVDDLLRITRVFTHTGFELALNDENNVYSCFTPSQKNLVVAKAIVDKGPNLPDEVNTYELTAVYRANHPKVVKRLGYFDPSKVKLELPNQFISALTYFVAARLHAPMGVGPIEGAVGMTYIQRFELECLRLEGQTPEQVVTEVHDKLRDRGFP